MRFGLFYELQLPRPWESDSEQRVVDQTLDQIELADRLGYDYAWTVEHHFLEEYSHCSAPEVLLGAASQRTSRIRLGHGIMVLPPKINHPARVAERIAMLDLLSHGRVEFGSGESGTEVELGGFGVDWESKGEQWSEALGVISRMLVEEPFAGHDGKHVRMPPRNVLPKAVQRPHPPLWRSCIRREAIHDAAAAGLGALTFSFVGHRQAERWVQDYYATIESEECVPLGFSVNPQIAMTSYLMCQPDEQAAMSSVPSHGFFAAALNYYYRQGTPTPGDTRLWEELEIDQRHAERNGQRPAELGTPYGTVGRPVEVREFLRGYEEAGVDQILLICQTGRIPHEQICESLELFAREVMPEFQHRHEAAEQRKTARLRPAIEAALARREPPRTMRADYRVPASPRR